MRVLQCFWLLLGALGPPSIFELVSGEGHVHSRVRRKSKLEIKSKWGERFPKNSLSPRHGVKKILDSKDDKNNNEELKFSHSDNTIVNTKGNSYYHHDKVDKTTTTIAPNKVDDSSSSGKGENFKGSTLPSKSKTFLETCLNMRGATQLVVTAAKLQGVGGGRFSSSLPKTLNSKTKTGEGDESSLSSIQDDFEVSVPSLGNSSVISEILQNLGGSFTRDEYGWRRRIDDSDEKQLDDNEEGESPLSPLEEKSFRRFLKNPNDDSKSHSQLTISIPSIEDGQSPSSKRITISYLRRPRRKPPTPVKNHPSPPPPPLTKESPGKSSQKGNTPSRKLDPSSSFPPYSTTTPRVRRTPSRTKQGGPTTTRPPKKKLLSPPKGNVMDSNEDVRRSSNRHNSSNSSSKSESSGVRTTDSRYSSISTTGGAGWLRPEYIIYTMALFVSFIVVGACLYMVLVAFAI